MILGENIQYVYTDAQHKNPLRESRLEFIKQGKDQEQRYDKEKYRDMLIEAAETGLGYFGFARTAFGATKKRNRKWWSALREERNRDIENEKL